MAVSIDKYTCPFCGQKAIFVGVCDDEGNYKGRPGCEYESNPWSGLCYAIHHDGWGDCILCTDAHDLPLGGCFFDTAEDAFRAIPTLAQPNEGAKDKNVPTNEPLTLDDLRKIDTVTPLWVRDLSWGQHKPRLMLVRHVTSNYWSCVDFDGFETIKSDDYGSRYLIYRRPPEGEEEKP